MAATYSEEARTNTIALLAGAGGINFSVRLYRNNPTINDSITLAALQEANYDSYLPYNSALWSPPAIDTGGDAYTLSPAIVFTRTSGINANIIYGYYLTAEDPVAGTVLLQVQKFPSALPMVVATDQIPLRVLYAMRAVVVSTLIAPVP